MKEAPYITVDAPKPKPPFMRRLLKKLVIGLGVIFAVVLLGAVVIAAFFEEEIGEKLVVEINKSLSSELTVKDFEMLVIAE